jgi:hypothetical protein
MVDDWQSPDRMDPTGAFLTFLMSAQVDVKRFAHWENWLPKNTALTLRPGLETASWAILGNARRQPWQIRQSRQRGICNLQISDPAGCFLGIWYPHCLLSSRFIENL